MAATPSIRITKSFSYRGSTRLWSNRYHLLASGALTATTEGQILDAVTTAERAIFASNVTIVKGEFMNAGSDLPVVTNTYSLAGTFTLGTLIKAPGDCAALVKNSTDQRTSKNHPIYLFSYWHGVLFDATVGVDLVAAAQKTAMQTYASSWVSGITYGGGAGVVTRHGPNGASALVATVDPYVRHRDFS